MRKSILLMMALGPCATQAHMVDSKVYIELGAGGASLFSDAQGVTNLTPLYNVQTVFPATGTATAYDVTNLGNVWGNLAVIGALRLGSDWRLPDSKCLFGLYINGGVSGAHSNNLYARLYTDSFSTLTSPAYLNVWERGFLGAGLRFGVAAGDRTLLFATLGWSIRNTRVRFGGVTTYFPAIIPPGLQTDSTFTTQNLYKTVNKWINCLVTGLGMDVNLNDHWIMGVLCEVNIGGRANFGFGNNTFTLGNGEYDNLSFKVRPTVSQCMVTFKYAIPRCEEVTMVSHPVCIPECPVPSSPQPPLCFPEGLSAPQ